MKFIICLKDPDGFYEAVNQAAKNLITRTPNAKVKEAAVEANSEWLNDFLADWVEYGEYVTLEGDTEAGTLRVLKSKDLPK
jgi:hypothetical protein